MKNIKQIAFYFWWTIVAMLMAFGYVSLLLGPVPDEESYGKFSFVAQLFYGYGLLYVGLAIGSVAAILFVLTDKFFLTKRLQNKSHKTLVRLLVLSLIMAIVAIIHYILEKVIDVI